MELFDGYVVFFYNMGFGYRRVVFKKVYDIGDEVIIVKKVIDCFGYSFILKIFFKGVEEVFVSRRFFYSGWRRCLKFVNVDYVYWGGIENRIIIFA